MKSKIEAEVGAQGCHFLDATHVATALLGDSIACNLFLLGFAWQRGLVPVSAAALEEAIALNGVAVNFNQQAFLWGRRYAEQPDTVLSLIASEERQPLPTTLDEVIDDRSRRLAEYQDTHYATRYRDYVTMVRRTDSRAADADSLTLAVARNLYKLMAYKDEYEVARLYTDGSFQRQLEAQFEGDFELRFNMAPPLFSKRDPDTGQLIKQEFGPWMMQAFGWLAKLRFLRGTWLDVFGRTAERRRERADIEDYRHLIDTLLPELTEQNYPLALQLANLASKLRGYGHVKDRNRELLALQQAELLTRFRGESPVTAVNIIEARQGVS
jgi:indolepyruvate ferredoxin oxidoreductase